jgi:putative FmdB family regulatory protein
MYGTSTSQPGLLPIHFTVCYDSCSRMPIYEYQCRHCGQQFELLVLGSTVAVCPSCQSRELEQLISGFAVSSETISRANIKAARRKFATSSDYRDKQVAEAEEIKEHNPGFFTKPIKP